MWPTLHRKHSDAVFHEKIFPPSALENETFKFQLIFLSSRGTDLVIANKTLKYSFDVSFIIFAILCVFFFFFIPFHFFVLFPFFLLFFQSISQVLSVCSSCLTGTMPYRVETPVLIRTTKLSNVGSGEYLDWRRLGNTSCAVNVMYNNLELEIAEAITNSSWDCCIHLRVNTMVWVWIRLVSPSYELINSTCIKKHLCLKSGTELTYFLDLYKLQKVDKPYKTNQYREYSGSKIAFPFF